VSVKTIKIRVPNIRKGRADKKHYGIFKLEPHIQGLIQQNYRISGAWTSAYEEQNDEKLKRVVELGYKEVKYIRFRGDPLDE
jgi:hypothetical protein